MRISKNSTLFYTSSEPIESDPGDKRNNPGSVYSCALEAYGEACVDSQRLAVGLDTETTTTTTTSSEDSGWYSLMNLQLFQHDGKGTDYALYASTLKESVEHEQVYSWKIFRADVELPPLDGDNQGVLQSGTVHSGDGGDGHHFFKPYFRTLSEFDWNNCNFGCCPFGNNVRDSNGWTFNRTRTELTYQHAYIRVKPRAYAVDHRTGEIFVAWEGFYKNCIDPNPSPVAEWTVGVSRLLTTKRCVSTTDENGEVEPASDYGELGLNFVACTEPVAIVDVDNRNLNGRKTGLAYGGFAVVPAANEPPSPGAEPRRSFLLSVFRTEQTTVRAPVSYLWAVPEGVDASQYADKRQTLSFTTLSQKVEFGSSLKGSGTWNGGNIRVHYDRQTGLPDYLCRSVWTEGILCMPIEMTENGESVRTIGNEIRVLSRAQVASFCDTGQVFEKISNSTENSKRKSKYVGGLDILWNEEDGTPYKVFFGCVGIEKNGKLGSVDWYGGNVVEALPGAYSGDVLLLPGKPVPLGREASPTTSSGDHTPDFHVVITSAGDDKKKSSIEPRGLTIICLLMTVICVVVYAVGVTLFGIHRNRSSSMASSSKSKSTITSSENDDNRPAGIPDDEDLPIEIPDDEDLQIEILDDEDLPTETPNAQTVNYLL